MKFPHFSRIVCALAFAWVTSCEFAGGPTGPGGGTEGEGLTGILVDSYGGPVAQVRVRIYPDDTAPLAKGAAAPHADSVTTNDEGRFDFKMLVAGARYNLAASFSQGDTAFSVFIQDILYSGGRQDLGEDTLMLTGGIVLRVQNGGSALPAGARCDIAGSPFRGLVSDSGTCVLTGLPPGVFQVEIVAPGFHIALTDAVTVVQGVLSGGGSVELIPADQPSLPSGRHFATTSSTLAQWTFNAYGTDGALYTFADLGPRLDTLKGDEPMPLAASPYGAAVEFETTSPPVNKFFHGVRDSVYNPDVTKWLTLEARVYLTNYPSASNNSEVGMVAGIPAGARLMIGSDGSLQAAGLAKDAAESGWIQHPRSAAGVVPLGKWVDIAVTVDVNGSQLYGYVDGQPVQLTWPSTYSRKAGGAWSNNYFSVGSSTVFTQPFTGRIDEVRVSNAAVLGLGLPLIIPPLDTIPVVPRDSNAIPGE